MPLPYPCTWAEWLAASPADREAFNAEWSRRLGQYLRTGTAYRDEFAGDLSPADLQADADEAREEGTYR